jgi:hypothetical protein
MENNKFTLQDFLTMHELIVTLRGESKPVNDHVDSICIDQYWFQLDQLVIKLANTFKDQLIVTKEAVEQLYGKKIHTFEKIYDEEGMLTAIKVVPVQSVEFINVSFNISPTGEVIHHDENKEES